MFTALRSKLATAAVLASAAMVTSPAFAAIPTVDALAEIDNAKTFVTTVGLAVLGLIFVVKGIKWARKAG